MPTFQIIGHRGAKDEAPENTVPGFHYTRRLGLDAVELDVHLSRDDKLVVIHDNTVDRTTTASGSVSDFSASELAALDARGAFPDWPEVPGVPTLDQALDALGDMPTIQIEIKKDTDRRMEQVVEAALDTISRRGIASRVTLSSFEPHAVETVGRLAPSQARAFIGAFDTPDYLQTTLRLGCTQADISLTTSSADMASKIRNAGLRVVGFQCNTPGALERALAWRIDGATSDVPSSILRLLPEA